MVAIDESGVASGTDDAPEIAFTVQMDTTSSLIAIAGDLDAETAPLFAGVVDAQIEHHRVDLCVDVAALTFFDLAGFSALCAARRRLEHHGGGLRVVHAGTLLRFVAELFDQEALLDVSSAGSLAPRSRA